MVLLALGAGSQIKYSYPSVLLRQMMVWSKQRKSQFQYCKFVIHLHFYKISGFESAN